jgi:predicted metal-binding membrane protein
MMAMRMPGESAAAAASSFILMWGVMMVAMMLPSLTPTLWRYREWLHHSGIAGVAASVWIAGVAYFAGLTVIGVVVFPLMASLAAMVRHEPALARAVPATAGFLLVSGGALQFTPWKARHLACCRAGPVECYAAGVGAAWRYGLRLALHCMSCCAGYTVTLIIAGMSDWRVMAAVTVAITAERLAPNGERVAKAIGLGIGMTGLVLVASAAGL